MKDNSVEQFLAGWFELWLDHGAGIADAHFPNAGAKALEMARASAYSFMDAHPDHVPPQRWAEREGEA